MKSLKELMVMIISAIMGCAAQSLFVGWTTEQQRIVFWVSILMLTVVLFASFKKGGRVVKKRSVRTKRRKSRKGKRRARGP